ncbi:unnamed protein product [Merluccius merluccius]
MLSKKRVLSYKNLLSRLTREFNIVSPSSLNWRRTLSHFFSPFIINVLDVPEGLRGVSTQTSAPYRQCPRGALWRRLGNSGDEVRLAWTATDVLTSAQKGCSERLSRHH